MSHFPMLSGTRERPGFQSCSGQTLNLLKLKQCTKHFLKPPTFFYLDKEFQDHCSLFSICIFREVFTLLIETKGRSPPVYRKTGFLKISWHKIKVLPGTVIPKSLIHAFTVPTSPSYVVKVKGWTKILLAGLREAKQRPESLKAYVYPDFISATYE